MASRFFACGGVSDFFFDHEATAIWASAFAWLCDLLDWLKVVTSAALTACAK